MKLDSALKITDGWECADTSARLSVHRGKWKLKRAFRGPRRSWSHRESFLLRFSETGQAQELVAEVSPLPGVSPDSLDECEHYLRSPLRLGQLRDRLNTLRTDTPSSQFQQLSRVAALTKPGYASAPQAAAFGEQCLLVLAAARCSRSPTPASDIPAGPSTALSSAQLVDTLGPLPPLRPAQTLKLKVTGPVEQIKRRVEQAGVGRRVRLDANQSLSPAEVEHLGSLGHLVEFVEEPAPLGQLGPPRPLGFPLGLDESLWRTPSLAERWIESKHVAAVVLKPMVLGLQECLRWANLGSRHGSAVIVSHLMDGAVAARYYRHLAGYLASEGVAMGLGQHDAAELWQAESAELLTALGGSEDTR